MGHHHHACLTGREALEIQMWRRCSFHWNLFLKKPYLTDMVQSGLSVFHSFSCLVLILGAGTSPLVCTPTPGRIWSSTLQVNVFIGQQNFNFNISFFVSSAIVNMGMQVPLLNADFIYFESVSRSVFSISDRNTLQDLSKSLLLLFCVSWRGCWILPCDSVIRVGELSPWKCSHFNKTDW